MTHRDTASSSPRPKHRLGCPLASGCSEAHSAPLPHTPVVSPSCPFTSCPAPMFPQLIAHSGGGGSCEAVCRVPAPEKVLPLLVFGGSHHTLLAAGIIHTRKGEERGGEAMRRTRLKVSLSAWHERKSEQGCCGSQEEEGRL